MATGNFTFQKIDLAVFEVDVCASPSDTTSVIKRSR